MAERSQYQYQPLTGPVWSEPVAEKLAWLPSAQYPARVLPPNRLGDFVQPPFQSLFKPEGLQWYPSDRYAGRSLPFSLTRYTILEPILPNSRFPDWQPRDSYYGRSLPRGTIDWTVEPLQFTTPAFDPQDLEWLPKDSYFGKILGRALYDLSIYPLQPPQGYDPQNLEWIPQERYPRIPIERRLLGDFQQPNFASLYDPSKLEWMLQGRQPQRTIPFVWTGLFVMDPVPRPNAAPPNLHKLYYDISSGRLFIQVSVTANPTLIEPL